MCECVLENCLEIYFGYLFWNVIVVFMVTVVMYVIDINRYKEEEIAALPVSH